MGLILFTSTFPYNRSEQFLITEFTFTEKKFKSIDVFPFSGAGQQTKPPSYDHVRVHHPAVSNHKAKWEIIRKGIFNLSPLGWHLKDLFKNKLYKDPKKLRIFLLSLLITRGAMATKSYREIIQKIKSAKEPMFLYFYWSNNLCWLVPYIKDAVKEKDIKIIIRLHGSDLYENLTFGYSPVRKFIFNAADHLVTISKNGFDYLKQRYPGYAGKVEVSKLGVCDNGLSPYTYSTTYTLVSVSFLTPLKRVHLIAEALKQSKKNITWHHFGDGPLLEQIKKDVAGLPANITVHLPGYVNNNDILNFYKNNQVDLFVNVSTSEGLPVSIMEAFSFGIPVTATNVGGTSELVNSDTGKLLPADINPGQLAKEIDLLFSDNETSVLSRRHNCRIKYEMEVKADVNYNRFYERFFV